MVEGAAQATSNGSEEQALAFFKESGEQALAFFNRSIAYSVLMKKTLTIFL